MGLLVTRLELTDFRSYEKFVLDPDPELTILVGPNAAGKTNVIEAIELLTAANSFRNPAWEEVVRWGACRANLCLKAEGEGRLLDISMAASSDGKRTYQVNGKPRRRVSEVAGVLPCVVFTPDDLRIIKDSAERRRAAVDGVGDQLSPAYRRARIEYSRILRHRNGLLREEVRDEEMLHLWTTQLVESGVAFSGHRRRLFERMSARMSELYRMLSGGEHLEARYRLSWEESASGLSDGEQAMWTALKKRAREEQGRATTLIGPHRDDVVFEVDGRDARAFASQGQQRTVALAWKLSEVGVIAEIGGQQPVLLLDDVMSELDEERRHALASFVGDTAQTFVTTTTLGYFDDSLTNRAKIVRIGG